MSDSCHPVDCSPPGSSVHGTSQTRILDWVAISISRGSSWPRDWTRVSCTADSLLHCRWSLYCWVSRDAWYINTMEYYSASKRKEFLTPATTCRWTLEWNDGCQGLEDQGMGSYCLMNTISIWEAKRLGCTSHIWMNHINLLGAVKGSETVRYWQFHLVQLSKNTQ